MDGENQIYWLVFGIGDSENDASWEWYLIILIDSIGNIKDLVLISDLNGSIKKSVATIFECIILAKIWGRILRKFICIKSLYML